MVWTEDGALQLVAVKHAEQLDTAVVTSTRTINATPCPPKERVKSWAWAMFIIGFILGGIFFWMTNGFFKFMKGAHRYDP